MLKKYQKINEPILIVTLLLLSFGLLVLSSASTVESLNKFGNTHHFVIAQILKGVLLGTLALFVCKKIDYHLWQKYLPALLVISIVLLGLVKVPGLGFTSGGSSRWISFGSVFFQPSEIAKFAMIVYLASWIDKRRDKISNFYYGLLPSLCVIVLFAGLILWQPDFGTMLILVVISGGMLFASGMNLKYFFWTALAGLLTLYWFVHSAPYRLQRLQVFLDPGLDPKGIGYHINQALLAIGSGGFFGYGYGMSRQKHNYLPEVMSDSIFAVLGEELGFAGVSVAISLFVLFGLFGYNVAKNSSDMFGKMLAFGITSWIVFQAAVNIAAMASLIPLTGIPLPFFSYGSTALILNLAGVGILLNISRKSV